MRGNDNTNPSNVTHDFTKVVEKCPDYRVNFVQ